MSVESHSELLQSVDWRYLVILDACRFDVFKDIYKSVGLRGILREANSEALDTPLWYKKHWSGEHLDVSLIGAHPYPWRPEVDVAKNFGAAFAVFSDVSNLGWGGVVHPQRMCNFASRILAQRLSAQWVIHFEQPHLPYIDTMGRAFLQGEIGVGLSGEDWIKYNPKLYEAVQAWGRQYGWEVLEACYESSLRETLSVVGLWCTRLRGGKVVITSDHGEHLGEGGTYGHPRGAGPAILTRVPWLEVASAS
jgi:hypothetical protein